MASTSGVLIRATDTQTHTKAALEGTKPLRVVIGHQAPDVSVEERTKRSSGRTGLRVTNNSSLEAEFGEHECLFVTHVTSAKYMLSNQ